MRYLNRGAMGGGASPRESPKDIIQNIRGIFYAQLSIENKNDETLKL